MTARTYYVQKRKTPESLTWHTTDERATQAAVNLYNQFHGWKKAQLKEVEQEYWHDGR